MGASALAISCNHYHSCSRVFSLGCSLAATGYSNVMGENYWLSKSTTNVPVQCEAPKIAKLVYNYNVTMVYGTYNYSYWGESKPT